MKKKLLGLLLIGVIMVGFTACGGKKEEKEKEKEEAKYDYLVLVNKQNKLPEDWEEKVELVDTKNAWNDDIKVEKKAFEKYQELAADLKKNDGITIELDSAYRSVAAQQELWDTWSADPDKGPEYVQKYVAVPGYSEHHTGLAIDIVLDFGEVEGIVSDNEAMLQNTEAFAKIHAKLAKYGFILRYLEGKDEITGYSYEPWHLRYINDPEIAEEIMSKGLTLEEYLESVK